MGRHKNDRKQFAPQDGKEGMKVLHDPKNPNPVRAPKGIRDAIGKVIDLPWQLESGLEEMLPTGIESALQNAGLAGKPILVVLATVGIVYAATKLS